MPERPITIIGAGGIGSVLGVALHRSTRNVLFVECDPRKWELGRAAGYSVVRFEDWKPIEGGVILLCVKSYDNAAVLRKVPASAILVPIQNGFDPELDGFGHRAEGIASFVAASRPDRFEAEVTRHGELHVGPRRGESLPQEIFEVIRSLRNAEPHRGFKLKLVKDILPIKHAKLMYNAAISPLAAAAGVDNGELLRDASARQLFFGLIQENYSILKSAGVPLDTVGPFHPRTVAWILRQKWLARAMAKFFEPSLRGTYCSMAGEIQKGRTEIDHYNGYLIQLAQGRAEARINKAVYELVQSMQERRALPDRAVIRHLVERLG